MSQQEQKVRAVNREEEAEEKAVTDGQPQSSSFSHSTPANVKGKRKRTSPHDHALLESAYLKNSKPNKEQRLELVELVDLGEKEVQIWFQNRRQNDRRKSKPLLPHELIPHFRNAIPTEATSKQLPTPQNSQEASPNQEDSELESSFVQQQDSSPNGNAVSFLNTPITEPPSAPNSAEKVVSTTAAATLSPVPHAHPASHPHAAEPPTDHPASARNVDQLSKKRSHEDMAGRESQVHPQKALKRTTSNIRLGLARDGSIKVRTNEELTPSPEKLPPAPPAGYVPSTQTRRASGLSRTQSDVSNVFNAASVRTAGRSRDARTWEFYCDAGSRDSLADFAESVDGTSAVGALGLIRSASQKGRLQSMISKTSMIPPKRSAARSKVQPKPKLARAQSSMARLQSSDDTIDDSITIGPVKKPMGVHIHVRTGSDSDKENWLPGTRERDHYTARRGNARELNSNTSRTREGVPLSSQATISDDSNELPEVPRVARGRKERGGEDLDCVQGLLSLSQGNWR